MHPNSNNSVPLVVLALEVGISADELAARLGDDVVVGDVTGLRSVGGERSRGHLAAVRAAQRAERERAAHWQAEFTAKYDQEHHQLMQRVKAIQARGTPLTDGNAIL